MLHEQGHYDGLIDASMIQTSPDTEVTMVELETIDFTSRNAQEVLLTRVPTMFSLMDKKVEVLESDGRRVSAWNEKENMAIIERVQILLSLMFRFKRFLQKVPEELLRAAPARRCFHLSMTKDLVDEMLDVEVKIELLSYLGITVKSSGRMSSLCQRLGQIVRTARAYGVRLLDSIAGKTVICKFALYTPGELLAFEKPLDRTIVECSVKSLPDLVTVNGVPVSPSGVKDILPLFTTLGSVKEIVFDNCIFSFEAIFNLSSWVQTDRRVRVTLDSCTLPETFREQLHELFFYISQKGMTKWE